MPTVDRGFRDPDAAALPPLLYALRLAPTNVVSPVREVSVVLVVLASGKFLAEGQMRFKLLVSAAVLFGLVTLTVGA